MKKCLNCNIQVGGHTDTCPLCQNILTGDVTTNDNWPPMLKLKKQAFFYKLQLFLVLAAIVVGLSLDFLLELNNGKHWSLIASISLFVIEVVVFGFLKKSIVIAKIISISILHIAMLLILAGWYYNFLHTVAYLIIPILISAALIANFVFSLIDNADNALVYLLGNILIGIIAYAVLIFSHRNRTLAWTICLMISVVTFIGIAVFKGGKVLSEVQKRMNF